MKCVAKACLPNGAKNFFFVLLLFALLQEILSLYDLELRVVSTKQKIRADFWENPVDFDQNEESQQNREISEISPETVPTKTMNSTISVDKEQTEMKTPSERAGYLRRICIEKYEEKTFDDFRANCRKYNGYDSFMINPHLMLRSV